MLTAAPRQDPSIPQGDSSAFRTFFRPARRAATAETRSSGPGTGLRLCEQRTRRADRLTPPDLRGIGTSSQGQQIRLPMETRRHLLPPCGPGPIPAQRAPSAQQYPANPRKPSTGGLHQPRPDLIHGRPSHAERDLVGLGAAPNGDDWAWRLAPLRGWTSVQQTARRPLSATAPGTDDAQETGRHHAYIAEA